MRARLIDAAITVLSEHGYAATTAKNVLAQAGVSAGALYRYFPSMVDLVIEAAEEIRRRQFAEVGARLEAAGEQVAQDWSEEDLIDLLRLVSRLPVTGAWYDLLVAARTDRVLRERLAPFTERYHADIWELALALPLARRWEEDAYRMIVFSLVHLFDGEAIAAPLHPDPDLERARTHALAVLLRGGAIPGLRVAEAVD